MDTHRSDADEALRHALSAFERSVQVGPSELAPALPAFVGLLRAVGSVTRFLLDVALARDRTDPIHLAPRILRIA